MGNVIPDVDAAAPGTGNDPASPVDSSAGTLNADTATSGPPEFIPYERFKEVNDRLRPYKELETMGYDPDSLTRLAEWEIGFGTDPVNSWLELAERIDDLPEPVKAAVREARQQAEGVPTGTDQGQTRPRGDQRGDAQDEPPEWAKVLIQDFEARKQNEQAMATRQTQQQMLDSVLQKWSALDKAENVEVTVPDKLKLTFIAGAAGSAEDLDQLLTVARAEAMEAISLGRDVPAPVPFGRTPRPVPGGTAAPSAPPVSPKTLEEATALAKADFEAGRLKLGS